MGRRLAEVWLLLVVLAAVAAPWVAPWAPDRQDLSAPTAPPGTPNHVLGTDDLGRDVFSRVLYGCQATLVVGAVTVAIAGLFGTVLGLAAGIGGRWADEVIMLSMDGLLAVPTVLLAIGVVSFLGYGLVPVMVALGVVFSPVFARLARAETRSLLAEGYILASRALGATRFQIVYRHVLPNISGPLVTQVALTFATALVVESSLSYLGLGTQPPEASWGLMLKDGRSYLIQAPWLSIVPGLAIAGTVLSCQVVGDHLNQGFHPLRTPAPRA